MMRGLVLLGGRRRGVVVQAAEDREDRVGCPVDVGVEYAFLGCLFDDPGNHAVQRREDDVAVLTEMEVLGVLHSQRPIEGHRVRVLVQNRRAFVEDGEELVQNTLGAVCGGSQTWKGHLRDLHESRFDQLGLVGKVVVQAATRDVRVPCDLADCRSRVPYFADAAHRGIEDATSRYLALGSDRPAQLR